MNLLLNLELLPGLAAELSHLPGTKLDVWGGPYDPVSQTFYLPKAPVPEQSAALLGRYLDEEMQTALVNQDAVVDTTLYMKEKYILSAACARHNIPHALLIFYEGWQLFLSGSSEVTSLPACMPDLPVPPLPRLCTPPGEDPVFSAVRNFLEAPDPQPVAIHLDTGKKTALTARHEDSYWNTGQRGDASAVSCGEKTASVTPMSETKLDLSRLTASLPLEACILRKSGLFVEFTVYGYRCLLFQSGRLMVTGTEEVNTAKWIYRQCVGGAFLA